MEAMSKIYLKLCFLWSAKVSLALVISHNSHFPNFHCDCDTSTRVLSRIDLSIAADLSSFRTTNAQHLFGTFVP